MIPDLELLSIFVMGITLLFNILALRWGIPLIQIFCFVFSLLMLPAVWSDYGVMPLYLIFVELSHGLLVAVGVLNAR